MPLTGCVDDGIICKRRSSSSRAEWRRPCLQYTRRGQRFWVQGSPRKYYYCTHYYQRYLPQYYRLIVNSVGRAPGVWSAVCFKTFEEVFEKFESYSKTPSNIWKTSSNIWKTSSKYSKTSLN